MLAHYGAAALPCRIQDPDRKGKVESGDGHPERTPLKGQRFDSLEAAGSYLDHWEERWADYTHSRHYQTTGVTKLRWTCHALLSSLSFLNTNSIACWMRRSESTSILPSGVNRNRLVVGIGVHHVLPLPGCLDNWAHVHCVTGPGGTVGGPRLRPPQILDLS